MAQLTREALQYFLIENGCKVRSSDAVEFFKINFAHKLSDFAENKELFKKYMEELTRAETTDAGERYLILKRQHMMPCPSPNPYGSPRSLRNTHRLASPRTSKQESSSLAVGASLGARTPPQSPRITVNLTSSFEMNSDDGRSPLGSGYDTDDLEDEDFDEMELGSVGGCSSANVPLEASQRDWIISSVTGDMDAITRLLLQDKSLVKYRDAKHFSGYSGLHWACKHGRTDVAHVLLQVEGCDVNCRATNGMTPLHIAAQAGHEHLLQFLLDKGADKLARDYKGKHAAHYLPRSCSDQTRDLISPPLPSNHKQRTPNLTRRPSLSSLDDQHHHSGSGEKLGKQYMSGGLKLLRSSFRRKRDEGRAREFPAGSPSTSSSASDLSVTFSPTTEAKSTHFVRPRTVQKSSSYKKPPSASFNRIRNSFRNKRTSC